MFDFYAIGVFVWFAISICSKHRIGVFMSIGVGLVWPAVVALSIYAAIHNYRVRKERDE